MRYLLAFFFFLMYMGDDLGINVGLAPGLSVKNLFLYLVFAGELVHRVGAIRLTAYAILVSTAAVLLQFALQNPLASFEQPAAVYGLSAINGFFCTVLPAFATMLAIERIGAGRTAMVAMLGPVATILLAWLLLDEAFSGWGLVGTALVLGGVLILSRGGSRMH